MTVTTTPNSTESSNSKIPTMAPAPRPDGWETTVGSVSLSGGEGFKEDCATLVVMTEVVMMEEVMMEEEGRISG